MSVAALAGLVDLYEVLIDNASGTDVEVSNLGVAHLTVRKTNVLARGLERGVSRDCVQIIKKWCWGVVDDITLTVLTDSPSVENHQ